MGRRRRAPGPSFHIGRWQPCRCRLSFFPAEDRGFMKLTKVLLAALLGLASAAHSDDAPYKVVDGYKVDAETMKGFRTWRAAACDRCHGANQEGLVGPSLVNSLKTLTKEEFIKTVRDGRLEKGMQSFGNSPAVMDNIDNLYAYLKGRSDGAITRAKVEGMN